MIISLYVVKPIKNKKFNFCTKSGCLENCAPLPIDPHCRCPLLTFIPMNRKNKFFPEITTNVESFNLIVLI
jgi:hypothetical protein